MAGIENWIFEAYEYPMSAKISQSMPLTDRQKELRLIFKTGHRLDFRIEALLVTIIWLTRTTFTPSL